ncbi:MAG: hypothetical protein WB020_07855 [Candidatus Dormiibacterota bacterium]
MPPAPPTAITMIWVTPLGIEMHCSAPVYPKVVVTVVPDVPTVPVGHPVARTAGAPTTATPAKASPTPARLLTASRDVTLRMRRICIKCSPR